MSNHFKQSFCCAIIILYEIYEIGSGFIGTEGDKILVFEF